MTLFTMGIEEVERRLEDVARNFKPEQREAIISGYQPLSRDTYADCKRRTIRCLGLLRNRKDPETYKNRSLFHHQV